MLSKHQYSHLQEYYLDNIRANVFSKTVHVLLVWPLIADLNGNSKEVFLGDALVIFFFSFSHTGFSHCCRSSPCCVLPESSGQLQGWKGSSCSPRNAVLPHWGTLTSLRWRQTSFFHAMVKRQINKDPSPLPGHDITLLRHEKPPAVSGTCPTAPLHCSRAFSGARRATFLQAQGWVRLGDSQLQVLGTGEVWAGRGWSRKCSPLTRYSILQIYHENFPVQPHTSAQRPFIVVV